MSASAKKKRPKAAPLTENHTFSFISRWRLKYLLIFTVFQFSLLSNFLHFFCEKVWNKKSWGKSLGKSFRLDGAFQWSEIRVKRPLGKSVVVKQSWVVVRTDFQGRSLQSFLKLLQFNIFQQQEQELCKALLIVLEST